MTKDELHRVKEMKAKITDLQLRLSELDDALKRITIPTDAVPTATTKSQPARIEKMVAAKIDIERNLRSLESELNLTQAELITELSLSKLKSAERKVLTGRYVDCLPFRAIAEKLFMTERNVYHHHRHGLKVLLADGSSTSTK